MFARLFDKFTRSNAVQSFVHCNPVQNSVHEIDMVVDTSKNKLELSLGLYNLLWGNSLLHLLPQYVYIAKPVYKLLGGRDYPLFSVPAAFLATDFIAHQVLGNLISCAVEVENCSSETLMQIGLVRMTCWFALSVPIAIYKYNKLHPTNQSNEALPPSSIEQINNECLPHKTKAFKRNNFFTAPEKDAYEGFLPQRENVLEMLNPQKKP